MVKCIVDIIIQSVMEINELLKNKSIKKYGDSKIINKSGDTVHKLDLKANEILKTNLAKSQLIYAIGSEEEEDFLILNKNGKYIVAFDPLDGSGNIDLGLNTGTIFGIFDISNNINRMIKNGRDLVYSGYALYGSNIQIILANMETVEYFNIINGIIHLIDDNLKINNNVKSKFYCANESNKNIWLYNKTKNFIDKLIKNGKSCRWSGCMVSDIHRILLSSGVFAYPSNEKNKRGKLRLLYECYPMAFILEKMGGKAIVENDMINILDYKFTHSNKHEKIPVIYSCLDDFKNY